MTYATIAAIQRDGSIRERVAACVVVEGVTSSPEQWAADHAWKLAAQPGWAEAWGEAEGERGSAITDAMILTAVRAVLDEGVS